MENEAQISLGKNFWIPTWVDAKSGQASSEIRLLKPQKIRTNPTIIFQE